MNRVGRAACKAVLRAYPAEFRRDYSDAWLQSLNDRHRHDGEGLVVLVLREIVDATRVAPRMRWESPMNRVVIIVLAVVVAAAVALAASPLALIPVAAVVGAAAWWLSRQGRPIGSASVTRRGSGMLASGVAGIGIAALIPAIDGGELSELWWTVFAGSLLGGIAMAVIGIIRIADHRHADAPTVR